MVKTAVVGAGLIGASWAIVFARAGHEVALFDSDAGKFSWARRYIGENLGNLAEIGLVDDQDATMRRIRTVDDLAEAVAGADYVQEAVFEREDAKREVFRELDEVVGDDAVLASSSSGIPSSKFTAELKHKARCLIAHPVNPPHLIPLVELAPAPWTLPEVVDMTRHLMESVGQVPILVRREIDGFILNRLQGALLNEAWWLYQDGYASAEDIDKTIRDGLGLRWSFMGPFQTIDLNAPGGIVDYAERLAPLYFSVAESRSKPVPWRADAIARAEGEVAPLRRGGTVASSQLWRDGQLLALKSWRLRQGIERPTSARSGDAGHDS